MVKESATVADIGVKERAMTVASRLLRTSGYEATRLEDIARELGVTAPALYWHFKSKSDLFYAILTRIIDEFSVAMEAAFTEGPQDPESVLRRVATAHTRLQLEGLDEAQSYTVMSFSNSQLTSWMSEEQSETFHRSSREYFERVRAVIRSGIASGVFAAGDPSVVTFAVINICEYSHLWYQNDRKRSIDDVAALHGEFAARLAIGTHHSAR